jgi:DNA-directed RNA polymerase subunit K/omega
MFDVSTEELLKYFKNRYEAAVVVAKEARRANLYVVEELKEKGLKPINYAIQKLKSEEINFIYESEKDTSEQDKEKEEKK